MIRYQIDNTAPLRGIKIKIFPTEKQIEEIEKNIATARAIYNMALYIQKVNYDSGGTFIPYFDMINKFNTLKNTEEYSWINEVSAGTMQCALQNLDCAYNLFFKKASRFPKYKTKKNRHQSVSMRADRSHANGKYFKVSGIKGLIKTGVQIINDKTKIHDVSISTNGYGDYWLSFSIKRKKIDMSDIPQSDPIGVDIGIRNLITTSNGDYYHFSDTSKLEKRKRRLDRRFSRYQKAYMEESIRTKTKYEDIPKSKNFMKFLRDRWKTVHKISNKHKNDIHYATKKIVDMNPSAIIIEDIHASEMIKSKGRRLSKDYPKMMFYEIHKQIRYKAEDRGIPVITANKYYPSSQLCSNCGYRQKITSHIYECPICGLKIDRDLNAAYNLRKLAYQ